MHLNFIFCPIFPQSPFLAHGRLLLRAPDSQVSLMLSEVVYEFKCPVTALPSFLYSAGYLSLSR